MAERSVISNPGLRIGIVSVRRISRPAARSSSMIPRAAVTQFE
jgi:hypothetical protein